MQDLTGLQYKFLEIMLDKELESQHNLPSSSNPGATPSVVNNVPNNVRDEMRKKALARNGGGKP